MSSITALRRPGSARPCVTVLRRAPVASGRATTNAEVISAHAVTDYIAWLHAGNRRDRDQEGRPGRPDRATHGLVRPGELPRYRPDTGYRPKYDTSGERLPSADAGHGRTGSDWSNRHSWPSRPSWSVLPQPGLGTLHGVSEERLFRRSKTTWLDDRHLPTNARFWESIHDAAGRTGEGPISSQNPFSPKEGMGQLLSGLGALPRRGL